jgi:hypothetical protein
VRVVTDAGSIELGTVEAAPTIGVTDYSRRVTDDFGVTTVVKRGFARRMSVRLGVPFDNVDALQRQLAALRATPATWIADDRFDSLSFKGIYKEFEIDLATPPLSLCTLTVDGLLESENLYDDGNDPAPAGQSSTLQVLQPVIITDAMLVSSSVPQADAAEWSAGTTYAAGTRVMKAATHRIYESLVAGNVGANPETFADRWVDAGPTNRWAMFDMAIGSATTASAPIAVTLRPGSSVNGLALVDTNAATIRVQAPGYDRTLTVTDAIGSALFLDLVAAAGAAITVTATPRQATASAPTWSDSDEWNDATLWHDTVAGDGTVAIGTLLVGTLRPLGITESSPTAGITDYSRKVTDDFGETTVVPRAWAKRMSAKALIRTEAVDQVTDRIAAVRALPSLWFGDSGLDSLTVYGFFKDFSIEIGESVSKLSLSIEGFSAAAIATPLTIPWDNVSDPGGTKPEPNADVTGDNISKDTQNVGGKPAGQVLADADAIRRRAEIIENVTIPAVNRAVAAAKAAIQAASDDADAALGDVAVAIDAANSRIDSALDDLAAEVARAQGADEVLRHQIEAISAQAGGSAADVRGLIETEKTVRADGDRAISQRIDTVASDFESRNAATNTRITESATTLASADEALAERVTGVEADYKGRDAATNTRITQQVAALSDADGAMGRRIDSVETDYKGRDAATNTRITQQVTVLSDADQAIGQRIDSVQTEYKGLDSATNTRITDSVTALSAADRALSQRIDSVAASGGYDDTHVLSEISRVETASTTRDTALGQRIDSVTSDYQGRDSATNTRITQQVSALSSADQALGQYIDSAVSEYKGLNSATNTRITNEIATVASGTASVASQVNTLQSDYNGTKATLVQQSGTIAGINDRTSVYWRVTGTTNDGTTVLQLSKQDGSAGVFYIGADLLLDGNAIFNGTVTIRALDRSSMTATTSGSVSGTYGGVNSGALTYIPNLGADMAIREGGSIFFTFTGNLAGQSDSAGTNYPSIELLDAATNSVLASIRLPIAGFGTSGRLDNYTLRILNNWGERTVRWRVATRASGNTWAIVTNPQLSVYWTAL